MSPRSARPWRTYRAARNRRFAVFASLYLAASVVLAGLTARALHGHAAVPFAGTVAVPKYLVLFVLDGAQPGYLTVTKLPHLDALMRHGTVFSNAMDGILETETPAGHTTIATGSTPARNGILGFDWAQNDNDYTLFSPDVVRSGAMEQIMERAGVPTIAGLYKAKFPSAKVVALSGHKYYAADPLGGPNADAIMYYQGNQQGQYVPVAIPGHVPPAPVLADRSLTFNTTRIPTGVEDTLTTKLALTTFQYMHQRITLINEPEFDWPIGHVDGAMDAPARVAAAMKAFDGDLGLVETAFRKAGILDQTLFVITADHGMGSLHRYVPNQILKDAVAKAGTTAPAMTVSTGGYIWLTDASKAEAVAQNVVQANDPGIQSVYYLTTASGKPEYVLARGVTLSAPTDAANRYLLQTLINGHQPAVAVFCKNGQSLSNTTTNWKADHGGADWQSQHTPLVISGPGVRPGVTVNDGAQLEDIAPTVLRVMGVAPTGMQGQVLTEALLAPSSHDLNARKREVAAVNPVVNALSAQYQYETSRH